MAALQESAATRRVAEVIESLSTRAQLPDRDGVLVFAHAYLEGLNEEDVHEREAPDLYGAILSLWGFSAQRKAGEPRLRVFNPSVSEHGWQSTHTVIEIVNDDMPFLVDSLQMEILREGLTLHFIAHPILVVERDAQGHRLGVRAAGADSHEARRESLMHIEVDRIVDAERRAALAADLLRILGDVRTAVRDWAPMRDRMREISAELERHPPPLAGDEVAETRAFLDWLAGNHFTFVGYRRHELVDTEQGVGLAVVKGSGLGLLSERSEERLSPSFMQLPARIRDKARERDLLVITKSNWRATVHRPGYLDYIGIKRYDDAGNVVGEDRFIGLYTSAAYSAKPADIPLLRRKVAKVLDEAGLPPQSHAAKSLANILDTYPRDELFQISDALLLKTSLAILSLEGRQRLRVFLRHDIYERFVACLIFAPRDRYSTELRLRWQKLLVDAFAGSGSEYAVLLSESALVRVLITVRTLPGQVPQVDVRELEARLTEAARRWDDDVQLALERALGEGRAGPLLRRYAGAFPAAYREDFPARAAVHDIELAEQALASGKAAINLYRPVDAAAGSLRFKLAHPGGPVTLSHALPMLERMGLTVLEERPYRISPEGAERVWLHDYGLSAPGVDVHIDEIRPHFEDAFARVFDGSVESDDFNRLVLGAGLSADDVLVLRAYGRYVRQTGFPLSQSFIEQTLSAHPAIARMLVSLFRLRLDPAGTEEGDTEARQRAAIEAELDKVANLNEDRVLRQYLAMIEATLRTNFWRRAGDGSRKAFLSFKFDPSRVPGLPEPRPMFEIFVYSPRFEGVHLRGGRVARGGLRWSDRPEDFRTEVLGLVKAQMVKNTVIVPVGSKGGFVLKRAPSPADRDAYLKEGVACYQDYLRGLLDITDNRTAEGIAPPPSVRRRDGDDPYLVVAADKGTATFSDYANAISAEYGFWLGDAFASGGSAGYDHKKMGITARGAWESVKRHFRELGVDVQSQDFTVVGIGDMSGDVFGNGMLLSKHIRLLAAFDHRHIFLDPSPDAATSFAERERLFVLPRSSWADYDAKLISEGGGVWPRSQKSIPLSPQVREWLGVEAAQLAPMELISAILKSKVDLLYNGGIGTYVKSSAESHADVGDRANDGLRVDGRDLRTTVVAEGGNLGLTQLGRIEYALAGGRIFTDAIDNSAGVDTSDHEVNLKVLLGLPIADGLFTVKQRNELLASMTDDVAALVLRDNYEQTEVLSIGSRVAKPLLEDHARFIRFLEKEGRLNRAIEYLPDDETLAARAAAGLGLTAPERAVLLAYCKLWLYDEVLACDLPDDAGVAHALTGYFPQALRERFGEYLVRHPLRREIIATVLVNQSVNRLGPAFVNRLRDSSGRSAPDVVRAHLLAREICGLPALWGAIEGLDNRVTDETQARMHFAVGQLGIHAAAWFLRSRYLRDDMAATIARFQAGVATLRRELPGLLRGEVLAEVEARVAKLQAAGVPDELARGVASLEPLAGALDVVEASALAGEPVDAIAGVYFEMGDRLGLDFLAQQLQELVADGHWEGLARGALQDDLADLRRTLVEDVFRDSDAGNAQARFTQWRDRHPEPLVRVAKIVDEVRAAPANDLAMLSVALRELRNIGAGAAAVSPSPARR